MLTTAEIRTGYSHWPRLHPWRELSSASGPVVLRARHKQRVEDFCVDEVLPNTFAPSGDGEHFWILVKKQDLNTRDVIQSVARIIGCRARDIGYSGLKDRRAVTTQWFSLPTATISDRSIARNASVEIPARLKADAVFADGCEVLDQFMHSRKLKPGTHSGNRFKLVLRDCEEGFREQFESRLNLIELHGFPNYFGLQRFGIEARNLLTYQRLSAGISDPAAESANTLTNGVGGQSITLENNSAGLRNSRKRGRQSPQAQQAKSMALSAARSLMFNAVLACRVNDKSCMSLQSGEPLMLANSRSFFICEAPDAELSQRLAAHDIQTTGPLWGTIRKQDDALADWLPGEARLWSDWSAQCLPQESRVSPELLLRSGLEHRRRSLLCRPGRLTWEWQDSTTLRLEFELPSGVFATALMRELCELTQ